MISKTSRGDLRCCLTRTFKVPERNNIQPAIQNMLIRKPFREHDESTAGWDKEEKQTHKQPTSVTPHGGEKQQDTLDLTSLGPTWTKTKINTVKLQHFQFGKEYLEGKSYTIPKRKKKSAKVSLFNWLLNFCYLQKGCFRTEIYQLYQDADASIQKMLKGSLQHKWAELMQHFRLQ